MWLRDPVTNKKSITVTMVVYGIGSAFVLATLKLLFSGNTIFGIKWGEFTGTDYGAVIAAAVSTVGALYGWRQHQKNKIEENSDEVEKD